MTFGQKIRKLRRDRDWTQAQLAQHVGVDVPSINRYEMDRVRPRPKMLKKLADAFSVDFLELQPDNPADGPPSFRDRELYQQMLAVDSLGEEERLTIKRVLRAFIVENKLQSLTRSA